MSHYLKDYPDVRIEGEGKDRKAFCSYRDFMSMDHYDSTQPTSPSPGRVWVVRRWTRRVEGYYRPQLGLVAALRWTTQDPDPKFVLWHSAPLTITATADDLGRAMARGKYRLKQLRAVTS